MISKIRSVPIQALEKAKGFVNTKVLEVQRFAEAQHLELRYYR